jgi:hypothetical protein
VNKNINLHISALLIFSIYYLLSFLLFNSVVVNPHDNLEISSVYNHIISKIYRGDFDSYKIFLSGEFKWYYLDTVLYPINLLHLIVDDKQFYFFEEILKKIISYLSFYLLGKSLIKNKTYVILGALFYTTLINDPNSPPPTYFLPSMPYLMYLALSKYQLKLKHLGAIIFVGLNSSLVFDYPAIILMLIFSSFINHHKNFKCLFIFFAATTLSMIVSSTPIILSVLGEPLHRISMEKESLLNIINFELKNFYKIFSPNTIKEFFFFSSKILKLFLILACFVTKNKNLQVFLIFIIFTYILKNILLSDITQVFFSNTLGFLKGYNFSRIEIVLPLLFSILLIIILNENKINILKKFLIFLVIFSSVSYQASLPAHEFMKEFLKKNLTQKNLDLVKKEYNNKNYKNIIFIIKNKNNYKFDNLNFNLKTNNSFNSYYKKETYKKIKILVGSNKVASIGIDPMIAAMNDINIIDGYHTLYQLSYKTRFRKIIEQELNQNEKLKDYFDNWGNRVYVLYSDKNNLLINFNEVKNLGADYIISSFPIKDQVLESNYVLYDEKNKIYLYRLIK